MKILYKHKTIFISFISDQLESLFLEKSLLF